MKTFLPKPIARAPIGRRLISKRLQMFGSRILALSLAAATFSVAAQASEAVGEYDVVPYPKPRFEVEVDKDVRIPMRDGVGLYADIYRPVAAGNKLPTILIRTQYNKAPYRDPGQTTAKGVAHMFASQGFVVVVQDLRGLFRSEGVFHLAESDAEDGPDTVAWISSQPWSNNKVGGYGCSTLGINQVIMSQRNPPALAAIVPQAAAGALRNNPYDVVNSGVPLIGWSLPWMTKYVDLSKVYSTLPVADMADRVGVPSDWRNWVTHELGDPWWQRFAFFDQTSRPNVPALFVDSWYDATVGDTLTMFNAFKAQSMSELARHNQYVIISPTVHCQTEFARTPHLVTRGAEPGKATARDVGDIRQDYWSIYLSWYKHWLLGEGDLNLPHVQYYVMGANKWKSADSWPIPGTRFVPYYLSSSGGANTSQGDGKLSEVMASGPSDHYRYDPADPAPNGEIPSAPGGATDLREIDLRQDRLVFSTEALKSGVEVTGPLHAVLYVSSSARDTDFVVQVSDVYPDGRVYPLQYGIARARYREVYKEQTVFRQDYKNPKLMTPGKIYRVDVNMQATSNWFAPGHRIRVQVSSSSFPHWERNLNTGGDNATSTASEVAENRIYHDRAHPSHVILPVAP